MKERFVFTVPGLPNGRLVSSRRYSHAVVGTISGAPRKVLQWFTSSKKAGDGLTVWGHWANDAQVLPVECNPAERA